MCTRLHAIHAINDIKFRICTMHISNNTNVSYESKCFFVQFARILQLIGHGECRQLSVQYSFIY